MKFILNIAITIYVIGAISHEIYSYDLDYLYLSETQSTINWLIMLIRDVGLMIAASLAVIMSITDYKQTKSKTKAKLFVTASILFCIFLGGASGYAHYLLVKNPITGSAALLDNPDFLQTYEEKLILDDRALTERISYSNAIASSIYMDNGEIINVIDKNSKLVPYTPTSKDKKHNAELIKAKVLLDHTSQSLKNASILCKQWGQALRFTLCEL
jgi:hypothetical protein